MSDWTDQRQAPHTVIIGASSGFGAALAIDLANRGHTVVAGARRPHPGDSKVLSIPVDVTSTESVAGFTRATLDVLGRVDGLVYCASDAGGVGRAWEVSAHEFLQVLDVGLVGFGRIVSAFYRPLTDSKPASVVAIGSRAAREPIDLLATYSAAKAGLEHFTRCLAKELSGSGIRVNCMGITAETPLTVRHRAAKSEIRGQASGHPPLPDVGDSLPFARWLLSSESIHVTGQTVEARHI